MRPALVLLAALLAAQQRSPVEDAWDLLAKGSRAEAAALLKKIIAAHPREAEPRLMLGSILADDRDFRQAIPQLSEAVRLAPRSADAHHALGEALNGSGDKNAARAEFEKAVALNPAFAPAHESLGLNLLEAGDAAAAKHLDRAIQLYGPKPESAYARYLRAKIHTEANEIGKASDQLKQAVALRPDFAEAWSDLGQARKTLLDSAGALAAFERSVQLEPANAVAQYRLGAEYLRQDRPGEAVAHLRESYRLDPKNQSTLYGLQLALRRDKKPDEAREIKERLGAVLREIDRESRDAFAALRINNEGAELEKAGNLSAAVAKYREAVRLDPSHPGFRVNLAVALLRTGHWKEGLAELREAQRRDPANPQIEAALKDALRQAPPGER